MSGDETAESAAESAEVVQQRDEAAEPDVRSAETDQQRDESASGTLMGSIRRWGKGWWLLIALMVAAVAFPFLVRFAVPVWMPAVIGALALLTAIGGLLRLKAHEMDKDSRQWLMDGWGKAVGASAATGAFICIALTQIP